MAARSADMASDVLLVNKLEGRAREGYERILAALDEVGPISDLDVGERRKRKVQSAAIRERSHAEAGQALSRDERSAGAAD